MEIITRQDSITLRQDRYFTGKPCKRGHLSQRYTLNACCIECLHPKFVSADRAARIADRASREAAKKKMDRYKVGIHDEDLDYFTGLVHAFGMLREPALQLADVTTKLVPQPRGGTLYMHAFKVFREDIPALRAIMQDLNWGRMSPEGQAAVIAAQSQRVDGWIPPPLR